MASRSGRAATATTTTTSMAKPSQAKRRAQQGKQAHSREPSPPIGARFPLTFVLRCAHVKTLCIKLLILESSSRARLGRPFVSADQRMA